NPSWILQAVVMFRCLMAIPSAPGFSYARPDAILPDSSASVGPAFRCNLRYRFRDVYHRCAILVNRFFAPVRYVVTCFLECQVGSRLTESVTTNDIVDEKPRAPVLSSPYD